MIARCVAIQPGVGVESLRSFAALPKTDEAARVTSSEYDIREAQPTTCIPLREDVETKFRKINKQCFPINLAHIPTTPNFK